MGEWESKMDDLWVGYYLGAGVVGFSAVFASIVDASVPLTVLFTLSLTPLGIWIAKIYG